MRFENEAPEELHDLFWDAIRKAEISATRVPGAIEENKFWAARQAETKFLERLRELDTDLSLMYHDLERRDERP